MLLRPGRRLVVCRVYGRRSRHTLDLAAATQRAQQTHARVPVAAPAAFAEKRAAELSRRLLVAARPAHPPPSLTVAQGQVARTRIAQSCHVSESAAPFARG